jgi:pimeloyl-ACP methyl ester carboxylesterase
MLYYVVFFYIAWVVIVLFIQRSIVFPRHFTMPDPEAAKLIPNLAIDYLETDAGPVETWFIPAPGATHEIPAPAVIFAHGNAELIEYQQLLIAGYLDLGVSVLLVEYRGYGRSAGSPTQKTLTADFIAAREQLISNPLVDANRLIYHGRSIGTGVICTMAAKHPPAALVLTAPFTSLKRIMASYLLFGPIVLDPFDNAAVLKQLDTPVLIFHGMHDTIIPHQHGKDLAKIAKNSTFIEYEAGHNDLPIDQRVHWDHIRDFLTQSNVIISE